MPRRVGLGGWLDALPDGLSTLLVGGAAAVSAGQRRRLLLARALISTVPTVLLDEPTEHLDARDGSRLMSELLTHIDAKPANQARAAEAIFDQTRIAIARASDGAQVPSVSSTLLEEISFNAGPGN